MFGINVWQILRRLIIVVHASGDGQIVSIEKPDDIPSVLKQLDEICMEFLHNWSNFTKL